MIIQVVGLPCSGKTYYIQKIKSKYSFIKSVDYVSFPSPNREQKLKQHLKNIYSDDSLILVESACGIESLKSKVLLVSTSEFKRKQYMKLRNYSCSLKDTISIKEQIIPADYTVYNYYSFENLISTILLGENNAKKLFRNIRVSSN